MFLEMFTTVNEHKPLENFVEWLFTDTVRDEARLVKALNFDQCRTNIMEKLGNSISYTGWSKKSL